MPISTLMEIWIKFKVKCKVMQLFQTVEQKGLKSVPPKIVKKADV